MANQGRQSNTISECGMTSAGLAVTQANKPENVFPRQFSMSKDGFHGSGCRVRTETLKPLCAATPAMTLSLIHIWLFIVKGPMKWALLSATVLSVLLSWGKNFMGFTDFFLDYIPMYDKFQMCIRDRETYVADWDEILLSPGYE